MVRSMADDADPKHKWWLRFVFVPLMVPVIAAVVGGLIYFAKKESPPDPKEFERSLSKSQPSAEEVARAEAWRQSALEKLANKGPPYCYRLFESSDTSWVTYMAKRVRVHDATGLEAPPGPIEPIAALIPEDDAYYYDAGEIKQSRANDDGDYGGYSYSYPPTEAIAGVSPLIGNVGEIITFEASGDGGNGYYTYEWSGHDGLRSRNRTVKARYHSPGLKVARVKVTSNVDDSIEKEVRVLIVR
jgi:hypothetical protein